MVTIDQIKRGAARYVDEEFTAKLSGWQRWAVGAGAAMALDYLEDYIHHADGSRTLHPREYARKYQYSTLPYFHDVMKI